MARASLHKIQKLLAAGAVLCACRIGCSQLPAATMPDANGVYGPYNAHLLFDGSGLKKPLPAASPLLQAATPWSLSLWFNSGRLPPPNMLLAGVGDPSHDNSRMLALVDGKPAIRFGARNVLVGASILPATGWHHLVAAFDGEKVSLYADGHESVSGPPAPVGVDPVLWIAPTTVALPDAAGPRGAPVGTGYVPGFDHFGGYVAGFTFSPAALPANLVLDLWQHPPDFSLPLYEEASKPWPNQTRGPAGYTAPQDPSTMPHSRAALGSPVAKPLPPPQPTLHPAGDDRWTISSNWKLAAAPEVQAGAAQIASGQLNKKKWMAATVPGTVLTTMIDRGIYPDPDFGLNNLAIPETLNKQDYWYRVEFATPDAITRRHASITFNGINYAAEVWLNGRRLGTIRGAFKRGIFDVTGRLKASGKNILAVRISPPPHPGVPNEQSLRGGPGDNGGALCLDGPTFVATEGWDWIPAIRDRNSGIWQDVVLSASADLRIGDPRVVTILPLPKIDSADVEIEVPIKNLARAAASGTLSASFEGVRLQKLVHLVPGENLVRLTPKEFPQLHLDQPRLWWPNGYGKPELYHLQISMGDSDRRQITFGVREVTYELSLFDVDGHLRSVEVSPTVALKRGEQVVDVTHNGMRATAAGAAATLTEAGTNSPAVTPLTDPAGLTDLVIKVNGVRIAARGGNWGMDDSRKRVSRERLEPFFKLHQQANLNIIRNWVGQNTEETFYQLADEYGMMVWNDFWASTQDWNVEPEDPQLFLENARDVVLRFRNHPSIVVWCGRNEGVPQSIINLGLIKLLNQEDGTRYYTPISNHVNLRNSGPYRYQDPALYYTRLDKGFSVELGIPSLSTLESLRASMAEADLWPISDAWAYHDWHQSGNGDVAPFMKAMEEEFGAGTDLKDFERKAQMLDYTEHRAVFEGFNQHLWTPNSGRILWMTQPAWPSNMWQIMSSDYDTQSSFYGVKKACEPNHVQMDISDGTVAAVNTTRENLMAAFVRARVYSLDNRLLFSRELTLDVAADSTTTAFRLELDPLLATEHLLLVKLELLDRAGALRSSNLYWRGVTEASYRGLNALPAVHLESSAASSTDGENIVLTLHLANHASAAALAVKATLLDAATGQRILPAYLSDNYISLLPGESATITARYPAGTAKGPAKITLRGWNLADDTVVVP